MNAWYCVSIDVYLRHYCDGFPLCMILPFIFCMIWITYGSNNLNNALCLVAHFFVLRSFSGKNSSVSLSYFCFRSGVISFFQLVVGVSFHPVEFVLFLCHNILCVCFNIAGESVEIVTVCFCAIFSGVGERMVIIG